MPAKNEAEVIIGGKVITLGGYESREYIQKVAAYLDNKLDEHKKMDSYNRLPLDYQNIMLQLNIADEFFKAKNMADTLKGDLESKDKEIFDLKHELINLQAKADKQNEEIAQLKKAAQDYENEIAQLKRDAQDYESMIIGLESQKDKDTKK